LLGDRDLVQSVLTDVETATVSEKDRALYRFVKKMVADSLSIGESDVAVAHAAGWTDEALYDAISVVALFQFYNAWIDASGVDDMPAIGYEMSGKRLASSGYVMGKPPST
jgi:alkylhydroperoxidase family enzyme